MTQLPSNICAPGIPQEGAGLATEADNNSTTMCTLDIGAVHQFCLSPEN